ncbi:MAG: DoxX family protein [Sciscionella sp.]
MARESDEVPGLDLTAMDGYDSGATAMLPTDSLLFEEAAESEPRRWHLGADLGLFVLRAVVGVVVGAHGMQHLFGSFSGPGITGFTEFLGKSGYANTTVLAYLTGWTELVGGGFLLLGLLTPLAAAGLLGVLANAVYLKYSGGLFAAHGGYELELVLAAAALSLLFTGPGRWALDNGRSWYRKAGASGTIGLLLAAGATVLVFVFGRR